MPFDVKLHALMFRIGVPETGLLLGTFRTISTVVGIAIGGCFRISMKNETVLVIGKPFLMSSRVKPSRSPLSCRCFQRAGQSVRRCLAVSLSMPQRRQFRDIKPTLRRLVKNRGLVFIILGESLSSIFHSSMPFDVKLHALMFRIGVPETGLLLGTFRTISTVVGIAIGGYLATKLNLGARKRERERERERERNFETEHKIKGYCCGYGCALHHI
eukprot:sb/3470039/